MRYPYLSLLLITLPLISSSSSSLSSSLLTSDNRQSTSTLPVETSSQSTSPIFKQQLNQSTTKKPTQSLTPTEALPNIVYILVDDFGWANADWHRTEEAERNETATPFLYSTLKNSGIELDRHYAYKFCSPSRSAIQSGRNPIHVNVQNYQPVVWNPSNSDPNTRFAGIPQNMTCMAEVLRRDANYKTHFCGKWDVGMATRAHLPTSRGYDTSLHYFHHDNDYWTSRVRATDSEPICPNASVKLVDLWNTSSPATGVPNPRKECELKRNAPLPYPNDTSCVYEDELFLQQVLSTIKNHDVNANNPMFLFWSLHTIHGPLQVPKKYYELYDKVSDERRRRYLSMVRWMDHAVENVTLLLKERNMYENTLIVLTADNGGPIYFGGSGGANNYPLKGGKTSNWEGGIRVNAMLFGGVVPEKMRGKKLEGLGTVWGSFLSLSNISIIISFSVKHTNTHTYITDWYKTFTVGVAGLSEESVIDHQAEKYGLPGIGDSVNLWPYLTGEIEQSPRDSIPIGSTTCGDASNEYLPNCTVSIYFFLSSHTHTYTHTHQITTQ